MKQTLDEYKYKASLRRRKNSYDATLATIAQEFIDWRDRLHNEIRGGRLMFDVPGHYKWLDESELFTYYMDVGRY